MNNKSYSYYFILFLLTITLEMGLCCGSAYGQEDNIQFEQMKSELWSGSLPLVNLTVDLSAVNKYTFVNGEIEIVDFYKRTDSLSESVKYQCQLRYRGGTSVNHEKKSFSIKLVDEAGEKLNANMLGIREENSWILDAMAIDRLRMRNRICFDVWNDMSQTPYETDYGNRNGTIGVYVEVFINGNYHGLYCMSDKIDRKLLGLKKTETDENGATIRGLLYKGYSSSTNLEYYEDGDVNGSTWNSWELQYPDDCPSIDTWKPMMDLIDLNSEETLDAVFRQQYQDYFYLENLVDYVVFTLALNVGDCPYKNTYLSVVNINKGHRFLITPWDMDMSLGGCWDGEYDERLTDFYKHIWHAPFDRLITQNIDGFVESMAITWGNFCSTVFSPESIAQRLDRYADAFLTSGAWEREYNKWNENPVPLKRSITEEVDYVKDWYGKNYEYLYEKFQEIGVGTEMVDADEITRVYGNGVYLLDGRKIRTSLDIEDLPKGIYIVGGKKVIIR